MTSNTSTLDQALTTGIIPAIETFPTPYDTNALKSGVVRIVFPEFTCVCPKTGYPDFGTIELYYLPRDLCVELKSWKLFLNSFRMVGTFHEAVTAFIFETIKKTLNPRWVLVVGDFFPRGNVDTTVVFEMPVERPVGADLLIGDHPAHCRTFVK